MRCDKCYERLPFEDYAETKDLNTQTEDETKLNVSGLMPKNTNAEIKTIQREEAVSLAKEYLNITDEKVIAAYDISLNMQTKSDVTNSSNLSNAQITSDSQNTSNTKNIKYQPADYNKSVKVKLSNLTLKDNEEYALLHIIENGAYEIVPVTKINNSEIEFNATRFSTYILITVAGKNVTFEGENYKVYDTMGNEIVNGTQIAGGDKFSFVVVPNDGYGVSEVTCVTTEESVSGDNVFAYNGYIKGRTGVITNVTSDLTITATTVLAPKITTQPVNAKVKMETNATFTVAAENATTYQWQYRETRDTYWKDISGATSASYSVGTTYEHSGYEYRCLVGNANFTGHERVPSDNAVVSVTIGEIVIGETPIILEQPTMEKAKIAVNTGKASYTVKAMGSDLTFTWEYRENRDTYWKTMTGSIGTSQVTTIDANENAPIKSSTLTTVQGIYSLSGYEFRCLVGNNFYKGHDAVKSDVVLVSVADDLLEAQVQYYKLTINQQPEDQKVEMGQQATFKIETEGVNTYQWQYKTSQDDIFWKNVDANMGTGSPVASGFNTNTLTIDTSIMSVDLVENETTGDGDVSGDNLTPGDSLSEKISVTNNLSGYMFQCVISNSVLPTVTATTDKAILSVAGNTQAYEDVVVLEEPSLEVPLDILTSVGKTKDIQIEYNGDGELSASSSDETIVTATTTQKTLSLRGMGVGRATVTLAASMGTNYGATQTEIDVEVVDENKMLITAWTIPVDADKTNGKTTTNASGDTITLGPQTTIKLPIPAHANNNYTVDWGDGSATETFDSTADFPSHTYENDAEITYEIRIAGTVNSFGYTRDNRVTATNTYKNYYTFTQYLTGLKQWGELEATRYGFSYCQKLNNTIPTPTENSFEKASSMELLFYFCNNLTGSIPEDLFKNAINVSNFKQTFYECRKLTGTIPEKLFENTTKVTTLDSTFAYCSELTGAIPGNLFINTPNVNTMYGTFEGCDKLTTIPAGLFDKNTKVTNFCHTFWKCSGLNSSIPAGLFKYNVEATNFVGTFSRCKNLTGSIPADLFATTTKVTTFQSTFYDCQNLTGSIPENLFANTTNVTRIDDTFDMCINLTGEIPANLFSATTKVWTFNTTFYGCKGLTGTIPATLFATNPGVTSFGSTFNGCIGLTGSIPATLFATNPGVTSFGSTFNGCIGLTGSIPESLFVKNTAVTTFESTFKDCSGLTGSIPATLFNVNTKVNYFDYTFENCAGLTGVIPTSLFASNTKATYFDKTFAGCTGITGGVTPELFASQTSITSIPSTWGENYYSDRFEKTFYNCTGLTTASINTPYIGYKMFEGCNNLRGITIGTNVKAIGTDGFEATTPYSSTNLLTTYLTTDNVVANTYKWVSDNRGDGKVINKEPQDVVTELYNEVSFELEVSGENLKYEWYEIISGDTMSEEMISGDITSNNAKKLTENNTKIFKSTNKGQANTTSTSIIKLITTEVKTLSFDYMVTSEKNGDLFTITIEDANGVTTVANAISGEVDWTEFSQEFSQEFTPTDLGEIIITLTYAKNDSVDSGGDYGAIRNLKCFGVGTKTSTFETDEMFTIINTDQTVGNPDWNFVTETVDGEVIFKNGNSTVYSSMAYCGIQLNIQEEVEISFDYYLNTSENTMAGIGIIDENGENMVVYSEMTATNIGWTNYTGTTIPNEDGSGIVIAIQNMDQDATRENIIAIKNLKVTTSLEDISTYENDSVYTFDNSNWEKLAYVGTDSATLTIPADFVSNKLDGNKYYCKVYNGFEDINSRQALLTIEGIEDEGDDYENIDLEKALITEWTIPVDLNGAGNGTTIKLPIPSHDNNYYVVDWGDESRIEGFNNTSSFPTHTYQNTSETSYTIKIAGTVNQFGYTETAEISESNANQDYETFTNYLTGIVAWGEVGVARYGFSRCINLTGTIPVPTTSAKSFINTTSMANLFYMCTGLNIEIPAELFMTALKVESFANLFYGCENLTGTIPVNLFTRNNLVTDMSNIFNGCEKLTGMIPATLFNGKPLVTTYEGMFEGCIGLTAGEIAIDKAEAVNMDRMFKDCTGLESLVFGKYNKHLNGTAMFEGASSLRAVIFLKQALSQGEVGVANDLATLGLRDEAMIYVPYRTNETAYEQAWSNIPADKIEEIVKANEPNPDYVELNGTYVDETGYTVAGFGMDETEKYTQYGFRVEVDGIPVNTSQPGSEWIVYTLYKK